MNNQAVILVNVPKDIPALFLRCIARDANGAYADIEAREKLADIAGECCKMKWCRAGYDPEGDALWCYGDHTTQVTESEMWNHHGRLAPLTSGDAASSIEMPEGYEWESIPCDGLLKEIAVSVLWFDVDTESWEPIATFPYTDPRDRWSSECAARVYAWLRSREGV